MNIQNIIFFLTATLLSGLVSFGCQSATPYKSAEAGDPSYGYTDTKLGDDIYRVTFRGNESTSREKVETYMIYRTAQLAQKKGFDAFRILSRDTDSVKNLDMNYANRSLSSPHIAGYPGFGVARFPYYASGFAWSSTPTVAVEKEFQAIAYVELVKAQAAVDNIFTVDQVISELQAKIERPDE